jgi:hypothetical protein
MEKFMVMTGSGNIYSKNFAMISEAKKEVRALVSNLGLIQPNKTDQVGLIGPMENREIQLKILMPVTKNNTGDVKWALEEISKHHINAEIRDVPFDLKHFTNFLGKDDDESLIVVSPVGESSLFRETDTCLWTNSEALVLALKELFEELWADAVEADVRINEIESGKPVEETIIFKNSGTAYQKFSQILESASEEIIAVTSPQGIVRLSKSFPLEAWAKKGIRMRLMAPITPKNLDEAKKLSKQVQIRKVGAVYARMFIIDNRHLFQLKTPPEKEDTLEKTEYFDHMLYTNDFVYVDGMRRLLDDLWSKGSSSLE